MKAWKVEVTEDMLNNNVVKAIEMGYDNKHTYRVPTGTEVMIPLVRDFLPEGEFIEIVIPFSLDLRKYATEICAVFAFTGNTKVTFLH